MLHKEFYFLLTFWIYIQLSEGFGELVFNDDNHTYYFNDSLFNEFFDCMLQGNRQCNATYNSSNEVYHVEILSSNKKGNCTPPKCYYGCDYYTQNISCKTDLINDCNTAVGSCDFAKTGVILDTSNVYIQSIYIRECSVNSSCSYLNFYHRDTFNESIFTPATTDQANDSNTHVSTFTSTKTSTNSSAILIEESTTSLSTETTINSSSESSSSFTTHEYFHTTSFIITSVSNITPANITNTFNDKDAPENNTTTTITVVVTIIGVVVIVLCSIVGFLAWKRQKKSNKKQKSLPIINRPFEGNAFSTNTDDEGNNSKCTKRRNTNLNEKIKNDNSHAEQNYDSNTSSYSFVDGVYTILEEKGDNSSSCLGYEEHLDGYTTIEETGNNSSRSTSLDDKNGLGDYNNMLDITGRKLILNVDNFTPVANTKQNKTEDETCQDKDLGVVYTTIEEKASSDYQRLGQERRDLKNPYQQLLQVEQEQQLVQSDQELSPLTVAKSVQGQTTLQIIDVGAWVDNSCNTQGNSFDNSYQNTALDCVTLKSASGMQNDNLDHTAVMKK